MNRSLGMFTLFVLAMAVLVFAPFVGMTRVPVEAVLHPFKGMVESDIFWRVRIPRVLLSFLAGSGLAVSGMVFQAMFQNPLTTPFTLGVSGGASLGAAVYILLVPPFTILGFSGIAVFSFFGASLSITLVYAVTCARGKFTTANMLLAGVAVSLFFSSLILFIQYVSDFTQSFRILRWLMGGLEVVGFEPVLNIFPFVFGGGAMIMFLASELNLMTVGDDLAVSRGVDLKKVRVSIFLATSLMVGGIVSFCGPIGFVGIMSPHICRLLVGPDHRYLTPASLMFGGMFLTLCDSLARTIISPAEIPVGVITALLGGPFFLWLLVTRD